MLAAGIGVLVLLGGGGTAIWLSNRDGGQQNAGATPGTQVAGNTTTQAPVTTTREVPADELCTDEIKSNTRWVCLTSAVIAGGKITIKYDTEFGPAQPNVNGGFHLHLFGSDGTNPPDSTMGTHAPASQRGHWYVEDKSESVLSVTDSRYKEAVGDDAVKVCARIATSSHRLVADQNGTFKTGNCVPITRQ